MEVKILDIKNKEAHNLFNQNLLLQQWEWGEFKKQNDWLPIRIGIFEKNKLTYSIQLMKKKLPLGLSFFYSPSAKFPKNKTLNIFKGGINELAKKEKAIFLTVEFSEEFDEDQTKKLKKAGFKKSFQKIQPPNTLILDISKDEEKILEQMKQKGRYNLRLAKRKKIKIKEVTKEKDFQDYQLSHKETTQRDKISARPFSYLKNLFCFLKENKMGTVFLAYYKKNPIAGVIISVLGKKATYLYGASSNTHRNVMAPYLLQWEAIKYAKQKGALSYDFYGIAPSNQLNHKWAGITKFKKQFGGEEISLLGSYDLIFNKFWYFLFKIISKIKK